MPDNLPEDARDLKLEKLRLTFSIAKDAFDEEIARAIRMKAKASQYFAGITFLVGAFAFFAKAMLGRCIPPADALDWTFLGVCSLLLLSLLGAGGLTLWAIRIGMYKKMPADLSYISSNRLVDVYVGYAQGLHKHMLDNRRNTDVKVDRLRWSYRLIVVTVVLIVVLTVLLGLHTWTNSSPECIKKGAL